MLPSSPALDEQLQPYLDRIHQLASQLAQVGFIKNGTVIQRYTRCGNPTCRCQADPNQRHGPYYEWSTKVAGKTITRHLNSDQGRLYSEWIENRRRIHQVLREIENVSQEAALALLDQPQPPTPSRPQSSS